MIKTTQLLLEEYTRYLEHVRGPKIYAENVVLHSHHIIPKCLGGSDDVSNLVNLSVEDHCKAHILLAKCFDAGSYESLSNIRSANLLDKSSLRTKEEMEQFSESMRGENNPFFGKKHSEETKRRIVATTKKNGKSHKDKTYEDLYGDDATIEKMKRSASVVASWKKYTKEERENRKQKIKDSLVNVIRTGSNNPFANTIQVDDVVYGSWSEAMEKLGMSRYLIRKKCKVITLGKTKDIK